MWILDGNSSSGGKVHGPLIGSGVSLGYKEFSENQFVDPQLPNALFTKTAVFFFF